MTNGQWYDLGTELMGAYEKAIRAYHTLLEEEGTYPYEFIESVRQQAIVEFAQSAVEIVDVQWIVGML